MFQKASTFSSLYRILKDIRLNADRYFMRKIIFLLISLSLLVSCSSNMKIIKAKLITQNSGFITQSSDSYLQKASHFFEREKYDSVLVYLHKSYAIDSQNWKLHFLYGKTAFKRRRFILANEYLYEALSLCQSVSTDRATIYFALGENEDSLGNAVKAKQHYIMVMQLKSGTKIAELAYQKMQLLSQAE